MTSLRQPQEGGITVEARELVLVYRRGIDVVALDRLSLRVPAGQFVCVMGPSGSGKSSLMHVLAALLAPTSGEVRVAGEDLRGLSPREATIFRRRNVGLVFQFFNLIPTLDVERNVALPLRADGLGAADIVPRVEAMLDALGMADRRRHYPNELSGGEMQRVAIARALIARPSLLLADEPTGNLDSATGDQILGRLRELCDRSRVTTILMTHDVNAVAYADRLVALRDGRVERDEPTRARAQAERLPR
jgi:putative ABC transport system ATP-binding protein